MGILRGHLCMKLDNLNEIHCPNPHKLLKLIEDETGNPNNVLHKEIKFIAKNLFWKEMPRPR